MDVVIGVGVNYKMTVGETNCPNCGNIVPYDEIVHGDKCMNCIDPDEVTINE